MEALSFPFSVSECAAVAERAGQRLAAESGAPADYSPESLTRCDAAIDRLRARSPELDAAGMGQLAELGVYLGESIRRKVGGTWKSTRGTLMQGATQMPYVLEIPAGLSNPIEKPFKRFHNGAEDSCRALYEVFASVERPARGAAARSKPWWRFW